MKKTLVCVWLILICSNTIFGQTVNPNSYEGAFKSFLGLGLSGYFKGANNANDVEEKRKKYFKDSIEFRGGALEGKVPVDTLLYFIYQLIENQKKENSPQFSQGILYTPKSTITMQFYKGQKRETIIFRLNKNDIVCGVNIVDTSNSFFYSGLKNKLNSPIRVELDTDTENLIGNYKLKFKKGLNKLEKGNKNKDGNILLKGKNKKIFSENKRIFESEIIKNCIGTFILVDTSLKKIYNKIDVIKLHEKLFYNGIGDYELLGFVLYFKDDSIYYKYNIISLENITETISDALRMKVDDNKYIFEDITLKKY